jgi:predicted N-acetyltransferase YhbS
MTHIETVHQTQTRTRGFVVREERSADVVAREALLDAAFGPGREERTCHRLRAGRVPAQGLAFTATVRGRVVGTVRLWSADAGGRKALMLGPLAVDASVRSLGIGAALIRHALAKAAAKGHGAVVLLGDAAYYDRFGFSTEKTIALALPGAFETERLLGLELIEGALDGASGMILPTGGKARRPRATADTAASSRAA